MDGKSALFLDIDGTLLDLTRTPDRVVVPHDLTLSLKRLHAALGGALAFVSGRSLAGIDSLFAPYAAIGCHGAELRSADGNVTLLSAPLPEDVRSFLKDLVTRHPGTRLEDKVYAFALHFRLAPEARPALRQALARARSFLAAGNAMVVEGKAVFDIKPLGVDKGVGVRALLKEIPFRGRVPVFGGDDTTDMDVFRILPELGGLGFSVGRGIEGVAYQFPSPGAVRQWLAGPVLKGFLP